MNKCFGRVSWPVAGFACVLASVIGAQDAEPPRPRSVLFYLMDTCRADRVGFGGNGRETTPFMEWLAERSVVFGNCSAQAPWTKPSMAAMLTSQYPSTTGIYRVSQRLRAEFVTWPEVLQASGMYTAGFSANIVMGNTLSDFAQGFDHFVESTEINQGDPIRFASGSARKLNQHAFAWLDRTDHWPMLLYMHSVDPHEEYEPEPAYLKQFADPARHERFRQEWQTLLSRRPPIPGLYVTQADFDRSGLDSGSFIEHSSNLYDADILANDDQLKQLWGKLQEDGWGEDLILVFTSDHGEEFFEHGATCHGYSLYDEMIGIPLMIYAPGLVPGGKSIDTPVRSIDIYPTLCELLGLEAPAGLAGESLVPLIRSDDGTEARDIFAEHREDPVLRRTGHGSGVMVSLRRGKWKLILNELSSQILAKPRFELFDLEADPGEKTNVAERHPKVVQEFEQRIVGFMERQWNAGPEASDQAMDPEVLEQLRALGYVGEEEVDVSLWSAIEANDLDQVRRCLDSGSSPDELDEVFGVLPLSMAAMRGDVDLIEVLLQGGANVNAQNAEGSAPLSGAAFFGRIGILELLLDSGSDPDARNFAGDTALDATSTAWPITDYLANVFAITIDHDDVAEGRSQCAELLRLVADADSPRTRLFAAIEGNRLQAVDEALSEGAALDSLSPKEGWTPLAMASILGHVSIVRSLLDCGADANGPNRDGTGALHGAATMAHVDVLNLLLRESADVNIQDRQGSTPLHVAAFFGRLAIAKALLDADADASPADASGKTPLDLTSTDWETTAVVMRLVGLDLKRADVERNRAEIASLLP